MSDEKQKQNMKQLVEVMEKEILILTGSERAKARIEYHKILQCYSKECGLEEPIYLTRA